MHEVMVVKFLLWVSLLNIGNAMNYYKVLGVSDDSDTAVIKKKYRSLALMLHPDKLLSASASEKEVQSANERFALLTKAYSVLSDESLRQAHDLALQSGEEEDVGVYIGPPNLHQRLAYVTDVVAHYWKSVTLQTRTAILGLLVLLAYVVYGLCVDYIADAKLARELAQVAADDVDNETGTLVMSLLGLCPLVCSACCARK